MRSHGEAKEKFVREKGFQIMYVLGIDVGTTGSKALLIDENGSVIGSGYKGYELLADKGGIVEQRADDWWDAVVFATRKATESLNDKSQIKALSLSTQGASSLLVDKDNNPLGNSLTWMDSRSEPEKEEIAAVFGYEGIYRKTGWPLNASLDASKLLWFKRHDRDAFEKTDKYVSTIEYINAKMTGNCIVDPTNGAIRQLINIKTSSWDKEIMDFIGVDESLMPRIEETGQVVGKLTKQAADELGLTEGVTVFNGAHDQYAASLGVGAIDAGDMVLSTGTAWVNIAITQKPMFTGTRIAPAKHVVGDLWGALTSIPVAGKALDWFRSIAGEDYDAINENVVKKQESSSGLFFYPYHIGARLPKRQKDAKAAFIGLGLEHDKFDMYRAVMEGVVFQVKLTIDDFAANGAGIDTLHVAGGATKSDFWMSVLSAVTGAAIYKSVQPDAACIGAAMIAAVGCGMVKDYKEAKEIFVKSELIKDTDSTLKEYYKDKYDRYLYAWDKMSKMYS